MRTALVIAAVLPALSMIAAWLATRLVQRHEDATASSPVPAAS